MAQPQQADPRLLALAATYQAQTTNVRARVDRLIRYLWRSYPRHDDAARAQFVATVVPVITGAQVQMGSLTAAFAAYQRVIALGVPFKPLALDPKLISGPATRGGVSMDEVNSRAFHVVWNLLHDLPHEPESVTKAVDAGEQRASSIASTYLQLAKTHAMAELSKRDDRIAYTRRVLEGPSSCGLCIVASTQRYHAGELMPIHPGCDCGQELVYADKDPGRILDLNTLQDVHARLADRFGDSSSSAGSVTNANDVVHHYRDAIITHHHGEIGPVIGVRGQHFTGPAEIAAA